MLGCRRGESELAGVGNKLRGVRKNRPNTGLHGCRVWIVQLLIPGRQPGLEHMQIKDTPEIEGAVALAEGCGGIALIDALTQEWFADRQPLVVGLEGSITALNPVAFCSRLVIIGTTTPAVIGGFVVVPDGNQGCCGAQGLEVLIGVVLGVALAVVVEADDFAVRQEAPIRSCALGRSVTSGAVFIDVVAQVYQRVVGIDGVDGGGAAVGRKSIGGREVGAREHGQAHRITIHRQGLGLAHRRFHIPDAEAVVVDGVWAETIGLHLDGPVAGGTGGEYTGIDNRTGRKIGAARHLPLDVDQAGEVGGRCHPGPEDDRIDVGITRSHAMVESNKW